MAESSKFKAKDLPAHKVPENELKEQFNLDVKHHSRTAFRSVVTIPLMNDVDQRLFVAHLVDRVKHYESSEIRYPKIVVVTRTEQDVELLDMAFRSNDLLYGKLAFSYEAPDAFGNRTKAATLFTEQRRGIFFCSENCLSADLLKEKIMEVIWHKSPSYAELFFRECFFTNAKNVTWIYRNAYLENQVIMGLVRMYHDGGFYAPNWLVNLHNIAFPNVHIEIPSRPAAAMDLSKENDSDIEVEPSYTENIIPEPMFISSVQDKIVIVEAKDRAVARRHIFALELSAEDLKAADAAAVNQPIIQMELVQPP